MKVGRPIVFVGKMNVEYGGHWGYIGGFFWILCNSGMHA